MTSRRNLIKRLLKNPACSSFMPARLHPERCGSCLHPKADHKDPPAPQPESRYVNYFNIPDPKP